jgi:spermidine synthase
MPRVARGDGSLLLVCFLSGAAALIFEAVWFHRSGLVFGSSVWATSLVLSSFMGGLTIGSSIVGRRAPRASLLRWYASVEAMVAVSGVALTYILPRLTQLVVAARGTSVDSPWTTNTFLFMTAFAILLVPATGMGATLPLLVGALARRRPAFGAALGRAYGWNTLGAVAGVVVAEVWLVAVVGITGSAWCAAALGLTAAAIAATRNEHDDSDATSQATVAPPSSPRRVATDERSVDDRAAQLAPLLASSFLAGAILLALEVIWFRFLTMFVLSTTLAASLMLATVLAGIALGGLVGGAWAARRPGAIGQLPTVAAATGIAVVSAYYSFQTLTSGTQIAAWERTLWLAAVLTLPTSLLSGVLFTLTGTAVRRAVNVDARAAGWLSLANTAGGMCGPVVAAFILLPTLGTERAFAALAAAYLGVGLLAIWGVGAWRGATRLPSVLAAGVALSAALVLFPFGLMKDVYFARVAQPYAGDGARIVATREGPSETLFLMQQEWLGEPVYTRLVTNGFSMSGTSVPALRYMRYFAYWPAALHHGPLRRVLLVCYGVGVTAGAVLDVPSVESLDIAEISADIVAASDVIYPDDAPSGSPARHPLRDPRVHLHIEDGRQFLARTADRFDLITGEPPPPRTPGAVNIYTREYFALLRDRLAEGGLVTYWLPVGRPDPGTNVHAIIRAFCDVFADCSMWNATPFDFMLAGSRGAASTTSASTLSEDEFVKPWTDPALRTRLSEIGFELPQQIGATFLGDAEYLRELTAGTPPLDDDHPQRLRPLPGHPSLSDPGYGVDEAVTRLYRTVSDPVRARHAFERSSFIRARWPERVLEATLPYFAHQDTLNQVLWEGGRPLARIESLHRLLTETPLRTLPLWLLGSDDVKAAIAARGDDGSGGVAYARGLTALARRDYPAAARAFAEAQTRGLRDASARALRVYALCVAGDLATARALASDVRPETDDERQFWQWLNGRFGLTAG